nr:cytochrome c oxidase assembly protein [Propylenella binzhouense]
MLGGLAAAGLAYGWLARAAPARERTFFYSGLAIAGLALVSPLCNLSVALFSARVAQHIVLTLVAAPLVALGLPARSPAVVRTEPRALRFVLAAALFALALWTWHLPGPYDATLRSDLVYWTMHATTFGAALFLWRTMTRSSGAAIFVGFATALQMSGLGALLTIAPRALFAVHFDTTLPWGLTPLEDQQLGGLLMWVPGGILFTVLVVGGFGLWLTRLSDPLPGGGIR